MARELFCTVKSSVAVDIQNGVHVIYASVQPDALCRVTLASSKRESDKGQQLQIEVGPQILKPRIFIFHIRLNHIPYIESNIDRTYI